MARIPYLEILENPEFKDFIAQVSRQRQGRPVERGGHLWQLYGALLYNPSFASAWLHLMTVVRQDTKIKAADQELVIVLLATINGSQFEHHSHAPKGLAAGLTQAQIDALGDWRNSKLFDARQRAILEYADTITRSVGISGDIFKAVSAYFDTRELVDLNALIAAYNFTMRFTVPMQLGE